MEISSSVSHLMGLLLSFFTFLGVILVGGSIDNIGIGAARKRAEILLGFKARDIPLQAGKAMEEPNSGGMRLFVILILISVGMIPVIYLLLPPGWEWAAFFPNLMGPGLLAFKYIRNKYSNEAVMLMTVTEEILEKGRPGQVDAWLQTLPDLIHETPDFPVGKYRLYWGSLNALLDLNRAERREIQAHSMNKFPAFFSWMDDNLRSRSVEGFLEILSPDELDGLSQQYACWKQIMEVYPTKDGIEILNELPDDGYGFTRTLIQVLNKQAGLKASFPDVFCPVCRSPGHLIEKKNFEFIGCGCEHAMEMVSGIDQVVGTIGDEIKEGKIESTYFMPIWDESGKRVLPGRINGIRVGEQFSGDLDWAISAVVETQDNLNIATDGLSWLALPKSKDLKPNTEKILLKRAIQLTINSHPH